MWIQLLVLTSVFIKLVYGDVYFQNMRGSNNRLHGQRRQRRNANRLFDSQNNARGGYNVGPGMEFYVGSLVRVEWTNQHSCGEKNNNCEIIVQYMCDETIRDGSTIRTIPKKNEDCENEDCNTDLRFGMHENNEYYRTCLYTERNKGLYTSTQRVFYTAKSTRQNRRGRRHGYECPEERDYYPYWRPSPWKDVAVMTNDVNRCDYYKEESENVRNRFYCKPPPGYIEYLISKGSNNRKVDYIPISKEKCEELKIPGKASPKGGEWIEVNSHNIRKPECFPSPRSRDNHNGNGIDGKTNHFNWMIPNDVNPRCIMRIRYNISTNDFAAWNTSARDNGGPEIHRNLGLYETTAKENGYYVRKNPVVQPFRVLVDGQDIGRDFKLKLAVNTAQFGRTFEDRTHAFSIVKRPASLPVDAKIVNVNVRGKRGNIVQTYPATEYDFVPNSLHVECNSTYIHFQWTGSNSNPNNNNGEGLAKTDRSNICLLGPNKYLKRNSNKTDDRKFFGHYGVSYPADMRNGDNILGVDEKSERMLCTSGTVNGNNAKLNDAGVYYNHKHHSPKDGGLVKCRCVDGTKDDVNSKDVKVKVKGVWYYMCTRNNNFTNRSQKARIICE